MSVAEKPLAFPSSEEIVELVGGPVCGQQVRWPFGQKESRVRYVYGTAIYVYEGKGKALYKEG